MPCDIGAPLQDVLLDMDNITVKSRSSVNGDGVLLDKVSVRYGQGGLGAIVGQSGSGKTTLLRAIAGIVECDEGRISWKGRDLASDGDFEKNELGYVPQFSCVDDLLSVREALEDASALRLGGGKKKRAGHVDEIMRECGLENLAQRRTGVLSGGQLRRLSLAVELTAQPTLLLCDEVTSGLDVRSEQEIWELLRRIATPQRLVLVVTHGLDHVEMCDFFTLLHKGRVVFHGSPADALIFFDVKRPAEIFHSLEKHENDSTHGQNRPLSG